MNKKPFLFTFVIFAMLVVTLFPAPASAGAYETSFRTSITYQNIGAAATTSLYIYFYETPGDTTPIPIQRPNLNKFAGTSVALGSLALPSLQGTAVMSSDQPLASTLVQLPQSTSVKIYPMSNGFSAGTPRSLIATVIKNTFGVNTKFSVQNAGTTPTTASIKFYNTSAALVTTVNQEIQPGAGFHVDAGSLAALGSSFNGSVAIDTTGGTGSIVSSAMELDYGSGVGAKAFEGVGQGSPVVYMPSAVCQSSGMNSAFAVQNTSTSVSTNITVEYQPGGATQTFDNLAPGTKTSFVSCNILPPAYLGSAKITSTATNIIAMGKISGNGAATAYVGVPQGGTKFAFPYVRWSTVTNFNSGFMPRTNLTIQNTGGGTIPAGSITVTYYDRDGNVAGAPHVYGSDLAANAKFNSNPTNAGLTEFGCYSGCSQFGGGALITVNGAYEVAAVARVSSKFGVQFPSEDYNGIPVP